MPTATYAILVVFVIAYGAIIFEEKLKVNKTASALAGGIILWALFFVLENGGVLVSSRELGEIVNNTSQIIFFLMGAMTIVELIDSHQGFQIIVNNIYTVSKVKMAWIIGCVAFFVSSVLDNLTCTIVMMSLLRKLMPDRRDRWIYGALVVIAANAGGAWTVIGDVTTTLLWIRERLTALSVMGQLFIPSMISLLIPLFVFSFVLRGKHFPPAYRGETQKLEPGGRLAFFVGIAALIFVPVFKGLTGVPPFMGMMISVAILWVVTDLWHFGHHDRDHLKIPHALTRIDITSILFFLGILLAIGALEVSGLLEQLTHFLAATVPSPSIIAILIGFVSAIIDNVPLVAASISMYDLTDFPTDDRFWNLIAYCAGTGGSMLIIGSAAGVALMGGEKIGFFWYLKRITPVAALGYLAGAGAYLLWSLVV